MYFISTSRKRGIVRRHGFIFVKQIGRNDFFSVHFCHYSINQYYNIHYIEKRYHWEQYLCRTQWPLHIRGHSRTKSELAKQGHRTRMVSLGVAPIQTSCQKRNDCFCQNFHFVITEYWYRICFIVAILGNLL